MALNPSTTYAGQIDTTDLVGYPYGKAQNEAVEDDGTGTPWEQDMVNDVLGFHQALLNHHGVAPTGVPDKVGGSQYLDAIIQSDWEWSGNHTFDNDVTLASGKEAKYAFHPTRTVLVPLNTGLTQSGTTQYQSTGYHLKSSSAVVSFRCDVPSGGQVSRVSVGMFQGAAPSSQYVNFWFRRVTPNLSGGVSTVAETTPTPNTATGDQVKLQNVSANSDRSTSWFEIVVAASDSAASADDIVRFIKLEFNELYATGHM